MSIEIINYLVALAEDIDTQEFALNGPMGIIPGLATMTTSAQGLAIAKRSAREATKSAGARKLLQDMRTKKRIGEQK
jgi:hypothetical protein